MARVGASGGGRSEMNKRRIKDMVAAGSLTRCRLADGMLLMGIHPGTIAGTGAKIIKDIVSSAKDSGKKIWE